ncbi:uncharacterized protein DUF4184 [Propionicimonas paludicola]|uniref:Uncharacterized protein DUF4184 n=1 Tax=Propionicimonas paludicola TaxID=185243 RepID=A0A2A9CUE5_9ACTN|nr:DUF4184 family protein [Propionicimonas paludicola]PFG17675.1 uncharacterized protein DUF4184 [Propionicimonas paludicola]
MPFTPSHVAAILPLRGRMSGALPFAALAIGSMSPDLPYYLPGVRGLSALTHTAWAVPSLDVVLGLVAWLLWRWLAPALKELAPVAIQQRWRLPSERPRWWGVLLALAIGAATHVLLDEFTHVGRFGATHLAVLAASYPSPLGSSWEGYRWAQYLLGAIGLGILAWVGWRTPADSVAAQPVPLARWLGWVAGISGLIGAGVSLALAGGRLVGLNAWLVQALVGGIGASGAAIAIMAAVHTVRRNRDTPSTAGQPG